MWFKSAHLYRVHDLPVLPLRDLDACLADQAFRPLSGSEAKRLGWGPVTSPGPLILEHGDHRLISARCQERLLPASVIREELEARVADREEAEGQPLRRQEKQAIKEQIYEEFLPQAFIRTQRIDLWWDTANGLIVVNSSSRARAEDVLDLLRQTLGSLKVTPLATKMTPVRAMTDWLKQPADRPAWLEIGDQIELRATGDSAVIRGRQVDLDGEEMQAALESGYQATRLGITVNEDLSLVLADDLSLKSLRFSDAVLDEAAETETDDEKARVEADFILMARIMGQAIDTLIAGHGGETQPAATTP